LNAAVFNVKSADLRRFKEICEVNGVVICDGKFDPDDEFEHQLLIDNTLLPGQTGECGYNEDAYAVLVAAGFQRVCPDPRAQ